MSTNDRPAIRVVGAAGLRRRWPQIVALGVLVGLTAGIGAAALAGARRADSALDRLRTDTNAPDAILFPSQVGVTHPDWAKLRARPEVADVAEWQLMFGEEDGQPGLLFAAKDAGFGGRVSRPVVVAGRMWRPDAPDEVVVTPVVAKDAPLGSTFRYQAFGVDQPDGAPKPTGPKVTFRVVGVVRTVNQFLFTDGQIFVGPGFTARYGARTQLAENADVVLRHGAADMAALRRDATRLVAEGTPVLDLHAVTRRVDTTIAVERTALVVMALVVLVAGGLLCAQAIGRSGSNVGADAPALRAMGMTRGSIVQAVVGAHLPGAVTALAVTVAVAVGLSRFFPVGLSRQIDPSVGVHLDLLVVPLMAVVAAGLLLAGAAVVARRAATPGAGHRWSPSRLAAMVRGKSPVPVGLGVTMALEPGAGRSRIPSRPALVGALVGVIGVTAAVTVAHAVDDSLAHPEIAGITWDVQVSPTTEHYDPARLAPDVVRKTIGAFPRGSSVTEVARIVIDVNGVGVPTFMLDDHTPSAPRLGFTVVSGRAPARAGEIVVGPQTAEVLHLSIGDDVRLGSKGRSARVVGEALFPPDVHSEFDEGAWIMPADFHALVPPVPPDQVFAGPGRALLVVLPSGVRHGPAIAAAATSLASVVDEVAPPELPTELSNLRNVRLLPMVLAAVLAVLGLLAVSYVLLSSAERRRGDFAVLRALGLGRRSAGSILNAQGTTIAAIAVLVGAPVGVVLGRLAWRVIAGQVPLRYVAPTADLRLVLILPVAVVLINVIALWPAIRVVRVSAPEALRAE